MICPNCGCECDENQMFCTKCGTKINSFENDIVTTPPDDTFENILGGISSRVPVKEESESGRNRKQNKKYTSDLHTEFMEEGQDRERIKSKAVYQSDSDISKDMYSAKNEKKISGKKKVVLVIFLAIVLVVSAVFITLAIKKASMTKKFDRYYSIGSEFYDNKNYKDAKTQFINASNNAFTKEQKIKAYEMVYVIDGIIGGYDQEEIKYLELLIDVTNTNIDYYKELIVLYQNNDMENKIDPLINSAPENLRDELRNFDGTIPVASEEEGNYDRPLEVSLTAEDDVKIYYTTDGSNPKESSSKTEYVSPIKFENEGTFTLRAYSVDKNGKSSKEMSAKYILDFKKVEAPQIEPKSGNYSSAEEISATAERGCKIYYTTDGTVPTEKSKLYKKSLEMPKGNNIFYFVAIDEEGVTSSVVTRAYNYTPEKISYNQAINSLTSTLVSSGKLENSSGDFENGDVAYFNYEKIEEINKQEYYIITLEIENKSGKNKTSETYAVSCEDGTSSKAVRSGNSYQISSVGRNNGDE